MKKRILAAVLALAVIFSGTLLVAQEQPDTLGDLRKGKEVFEKKCTFCHSLARALSVVKSRDEWKATVKKMVLYGSAVKRADQGKVAAYLNARSLFASRCNTCHSSIRVLSEKVSAGEWKGVVTKMAAHLDGLAQGDSQTNKLSGAEIEEISAFLTIVVPAE